MAIDITTSAPQSLLTHFKQLIDQGHVQTWAYDREGDFYHTAAGGQWAKSGYLRPQVQAGNLRLKFLAYPNHTTTWAEYGVLQGRFIESMISHCHARFSNATASAQPLSGVDQA